MLMKYISLLTLLLFFLLQLSCNTDYRNKNSQTKDELISDGKSDPPVGYTQIKPTINVYIENSGSMIGYVNGAYEFKDALRDLLVMMNYHYDESNIKIYFINSAIYQPSFNGPSANFATNLNRNTLSVGSTGSSNLNEIFKQILNKTSNTNISILLSDCIYSIGGKNTEELLGQAKTLSKDAFLNKSKEGIQLSTTVVKLNSLFTGTYWDKSNIPISIFNKYRPYYICIIGENDLIDDFNSKIPFDKETIKGFENKSIITSKDYSTDYYYSVLTSTYANGRFKPIKGLSNSTYVGGIENVKINNRSNEPFSFAIALDLKNLPVEETYLTDTSNYEISEGNFKIERVEKIEKKNIGAPDWVRIESSGATHLVVLKARSVALSDVTISIKRQLPKWIKETVPKDGEPEYMEGKSFGFEYLVKGIEEAYQTVAPKTKNYLSITIPIRKSSDSMLGKFIMVAIFLLALGSIFLIVIKNRKR